MARLNIYWTQTRIKLDFVRKIAKAIDGELLENMDSIGLLITKLTLVSATLDKLLE